MGDEKSKPSRRIDVKDEIRTNRRQLDGAYHRFGQVLSVTITGIIFYTAFFGTFASAVQRALSLIFLLPLTFLYYPPCRKPWARKVHWTDLLAIILSFIVFGWIILKWKELQWRTWYINPLSPDQLALGSTAIILIIEATRRTFGWFLPIRTITFIVYIMYVHVLPGIFTHKGATFGMVIEHLYLVPEGMFNFLTGILATLLFTFLALGTFLRVSGADKLFLDFCVATAGHRIGGPAKVAVFGSALMGMVSGSNVANVVTTGAITIPLMKRVGYKPYMAGAIEAVASTGGQIMPPIMGVAIFVLSEFTGVPLGKCIVYSILPAIMFFGTLYVYVHVKAKRLGLTGIDRSEVPRVGETVKRGIHLTIPVICLVYFLVIGYTPFFASAVCAVMVIVVSWFRPETRMTPRKIILAFEETTKAVLPLTGLMVSAALIVGTITFTGFMIKMTSVLLEVSGSSLFILYVLIVLVSYVMGMGLPIVTSYILVATLAAPALANFGVPVFAAHLAVFWLSLDSTITPPICQAAYVAASLAGADMMRTGFESVKIGKAIYYVPFLFLYTQLVTGPISEILFAFAAGMIALAIMQIAIEGYWMIRTTTLERFLLGFVFFMITYSAMISMRNGWPYLLVGVGIASAVFLMQKRRSHIGQPVAVSSGT